MVDHLPQVLGRNARFSERLCSKHVSQEGVTQTISAGRKQLTVQRIVAAAPERVFAAWTDPIELKQWWGPKGVKCRSASVELRVGGHYEIENELPDGSVLWIRGVFETVDAPAKLVYTWSTNGSPPAAERVTVLFERDAEGTLVTVRHRKIPDAKIRDQHERGWSGCLEGLVDHLV